MNELTAKHTWGCEVFPSHSCPWWSHTKQWSTWPRVTSAPIIIIQATSYLDFYFIDIHPFYAFTFKKYFSVANHFLKLGHNSHTIKLTTLVSNSVFFGILIKVYSNHHDRLPEHFHDFFIQESVLLSQVLSYHYFFPLWIHLLWTFHI